MHLGSARLVDDMNMGYVEFCPSTEQATSLRRGLGVDFSLGTSHLPMKWAPPFETFNLLSLALMEGSLPEFTDYSAEDFRPDSSTAT